MIKFNLCNESCWCKKYIMSSIKHDENEDCLRIEKLPDEVLIHILSFVDTASLYNFRGLNNRFNSLVRSKCLWRYVDDRSRAPPNRSRKLANFCMQNIHDGTRTLLLAARSRFKKLFPRSWIFNQPDYNKLTVLALENQRFPKYVALKSFPTGLHELSLRNSYSETNETFFKHSDSAMSELRVLVLDGCRWVRTWVLVSVSKYPKLQVLSMVRCTKALDDDVYVGMAAVYGFNSLRVCDVRHTKFADGLVSSMVLYKPQLRSLYFSSYSAAFYPDIIAQMKQELVQQNWHGQRLECVAEELDFDERKVSVCGNLLGPSSTEGSFRCQPNSYQNISDKAAFDFRRLRDAVGDAEFEDMLMGEAPATDHHSLLYTDPYNCPCLCKGSTIADTKPSESVQDPMPDWPVCNFKPATLEFPGLYYGATQQGQDRTEQRVTLENKSTNMRRRKRRRMDEMYATVPYGYDYRRGCLEVVFSDAWPEVPGKEYEECCRAYNTAAAQAYQSTTTSTATSSTNSTIPQIQSQKRKRRSDSNSSSDSAGGDSTSYSTSSSSDSESDGDNAPRRKRRATKKPRIQQPCSPKYITISFPEEDMVEEHDILYDDDDEEAHEALLLQEARMQDNDEAHEALLLQVEPREDNEANEALLLRAARREDNIAQEAEAGVQVIPVQQLHKSVPSKLTHLSLRGYKKITDATLDSLNHLHNMRLLDVTGTRVTIAAVQRFISSHPQCRVMHQSICTCIPIMRI